MKKRLSLIPIISLLFLNLTSAYTRTYGSYNDFSPMGFFGSIDNSTIALALIFILFFWALNKAILKTIFKENDRLRVILSFIISLFAIYALVNYNIEVDSYLISWGIYSILPYILLGIAGIIVWKSGIGILFMLSGILMIAISFMDLLYEKGFGIAFGIVIFLLGLWLKRRRKRRRELKGMSEYDKMNYDEKRLKIKELKRQDRQNRINNYGKVGRFAGKTVMAPAKGFWNLRKKFK